MIARVFSAAIEPSTIAIAPSGRVGRTPGATFVRSDLATEHAA
jgi:hypothetical protein